MRGSESATDDDSVVDHIGKKKQICWNSFQQQSKNKLKKETPSTIVP